VYYTLRARENIGGIWLGDGAETKINEKMKKIHHTKKGKVIQTQKPRGGKKRLKGRHNKKTKGATKSRKGVTKGFILARIAKREKDGKESQ